MRVRTKVGAASMSAAALAVALGGCGGASEGDRAADAVKRYLDGTAHQDGRAVCDVLAKAAVARAAKAQQEAGEEGGCSQALAERWKARPEAALTAVKIPSTEVDGDRATVVVEGTAHRIRRQTSYSLVREDGDWHLRAAGHSRTLDGRPVLHVPSGSMQPTFRVGDDVVLDTKAYISAKPAIGDIVAFHPPAGADSAESCTSDTASFAAHRLCVRPAPDPSDEVFLKRVIAGPGDRIAFRAGHAIVNGHRTSEPYASIPCDPSTGICTFPNPITIPPNHYYLVGDNRGNSEDSRFFGAIPTTWITGRVR